MSSLRAKRFMKRARGGGGGGAGAPNANSRGGGSGGVVHVSREHYLRDDIPPPPAPTLRPHLLVPDTNVVLHHLDVLEHAAVTELVLLQTVLSEVRKQDVRAYQRARALLAPPTAGSSNRRHVYTFSNEHCRGAYVERASGESPNDYNDRLIRRAVTWIAARVKRRENGEEKGEENEEENEKDDEEEQEEVPNATMHDGDCSTAATRTFPSSSLTQQRRRRRIRGDGLDATHAPRLSSASAVLLSNDAENVRRARDEDGVAAMTVAQLVACERRAHPTLVDVAAATELDGGAHDDDLHGDGDGKALHRQRRGGANAPPPSSSSSLSSSSSRLPPEYWSDAAVRRGLNDGTLLRGTYRANLYDTTRGVVAVSLDANSEAGAQRLTAAMQVSSPLSRPARVDVHVLGRVDQNRSVDGDQVAAQLYADRTHWAHDIMRLSRRTAADDENVNGDVGDNDDDHDGDDHSGAVDDTTNDGGDGDGATADRDAASATAAAAGDEPRRDGHGRRKRVPTGSVVGVLRRNWRQHYCGTLRAPAGMTTAAAATDGSGTSAPASVPASASAVRAVFVPVDRRVPRITITTRQLGHLLHQRVLVAIDTWDRRADLPAGHYVRALGPAGDKTTETQVLLIENGIVTREFSDRALACLPPREWRVRDVDIASRTDLRDECVVSVDPPGATDIDDALHCRRDAHDTDLMHVGVHIADVTAFVRHDSALDLEARERGSTVYLVDKRLEMLPSLLTSQLCSLIGGATRLAFSVLLQVDRRTAEVRRVDFARTVIRSRCAMTYETAQRLIDDGMTAASAESMDESADGAANHVPAATPQIVQSLRDLNALAKLLRARRMAAGALALASPEVRFELGNDDTRDPTDVATSTVRDSNHMVEEFMLLANVSVAERILASFPRSACLRRHPVPPREQFAPLLRVAAAAGVELDVSSSGALNASLGRAARPHDAYFNTLLRILATRCMTQAVYFAAGECATRDEYCHYGLAAPLYTHFTSPIRRYADVLVHRQLAASLGYEAAPRDLGTSDAVAAVGAHVNERARCADWAGRASVELHTVLLFRRMLAGGDDNGSGGIVESARILRVFANGVAVLIPKYGIEGVARLDAARNGTGWVLDETRQVLHRKRAGGEGEDGTRTEFGVLGHCRVRVRVAPAAAARERVVFDLLNDDETAGVEVTNQSQH